MWEYGEAGRLLTVECIDASKCIYCQHPLLRLPSGVLEANGKRLLFQLSLCTVCGWWTVYRVHQGEYPRTAGIIESYSGTIGCLKELDLTDISIPLDEVRQYFLAKKDSIYNADPKLLEDVVCSVFKDLGWNARVTSYSGDDGIDVILDGSTGETIGVQVKRYRKERRIEAEQIRSLAGALLLNGHTKGVFITTSSFRRGAVEAATKFSKIGYPIELIDAPRFLEAVGIAQIRSLDIDDRRVASYILSTGVHIGSGLHKEFSLGENLLEREIAAQVWTSDELLDLRQFPTQEAPTNQGAEEPS